MPRGRLAVLAALAGVVAVEIRGLATGSDTLSALIRDAFRVSTPRGRRVFLWALSGLVAWFVPHILKEPPDGVRVVMQDPGPRQLRGLSS